MSLDTERIAEERTVERKPRALQNETASVWRIHLNFLRLYRHA